MGNECSTPAPAPVAKDGEITVDPVAAEAGGKKEEPTRPFPAEWGAPPDCLDDDPVQEWPEGWGQGSRTTGDWIARNLSTARLQKQTKIPSKDEEALWLEEQKRVEKWEVKEMLKFISVADKASLVGLDDDKTRLAKLVKSLQSETLEKYLDKVSLPQDEKGRKEAWKETVNEFLGACLDSVNTRPPTRKICFIHIAAQQGDIDTLLQLVKLGGDVFLKAEDGTKPSDIAKKSGCKDAEDYLVKLEQRHTKRAENADKKEQQVFASIGKEVQGPRLFKRTRQTMFQYQDDSNFTAFSKLTQNGNWDCSAISIEKGVTKMIIKLEKRGTTMQTGLADTRKRPLIFGLIELTDSEANPQGSGRVPSWMDLTDYNQCLNADKFMNKGVWVCCETAELVKSKEPVASKYSALKQYSHPLQDVTPADIYVIEKESKDKIVVKKGKIGQNSLQVIKEFQAPKKGWGDMHAKFMMYDPSDCILVSTEPFVGFQNVLRQTIAMQSEEYNQLLKGIIQKLLPDWMQAELKNDKDPIDENGHGMYVASLITMLATRAWTKGEAQAQDSMIRSNYAIPFNHDWVDDLGKVLKKIWNNGGVPSLGNLRAAEHEKIPGSCKNKAVIAHVLVDVIRPKHQWVGWTVWRTRTQDEAHGRFPHKKDTPIDICFCQLHCVNTHLKTHKWFDVIRFWDRDPLHKWPMRYPDPELLNVPTPSNFDLTAHTNWMRNNAAPGGKAGYSCPKKVPGTVPWKLHVLGVEGDKIGSQFGEDEEEEEEDDDGALLG